MKTEIGRFVAVVYTLGLLASCAQTGAIVATSVGDHTDIQTVARNAVTRSDHEAVAKYYDEEATRMKAKAHEQKQLLKHYEDKSYFYGRRAQDLQAHTDALIRHYERGVKMNIKEAALHRQIALRLEEENYGAPGAQKVTAVSELHHDVAGIKALE